MQVGSSLGVAVLNSIAVAATRGYAGSPDPRAGLVHGYATSAAWVAAGLTLVLLLVAAGLTGRPGTMALATTTPVGRNQEGAAR
jgi:hypothetical protein